MLRFGGGGGGGGGIDFNRFFTDWPFFALRGCRAGMLAIVGCFPSRIFSAEKRTSFRALIVGKGFVFVLGTSTFNLFVILTKL